MGIKKTAFTLAEALITITIVGIVAALTIPGLSEFSDESTYVAGAKKAQAVAYSAIDMMESEYGEIAWWPWSDIGTINNRFKSVIKVLPEFVGESYSISKLSGDSWTTVTPESWFQSVDGMAWTIVKGEGQNYAEIYVDTNGETNPNRIGVDVVGFVITKNNIIIPKTDEGWECVHHMFKYNKMPWLNKDYTCVVD